MFGFKLNCKDNMRKIIFLEDFRNSQDNKDAFIEVVD